MYRYRCFFKNRGDGSDQVTTHSEEFETKNWALANKKASKIALKKGMRLVMIAEIAFPKKK